MVESTGSMDKQRIDKWLWAARFYKTRSAATSAINKGRVSVNDQSTKPSRLITIGDRLNINKIPYRFVVTVQGLNDQRRPAMEARELYVESEASIAAREAEAAFLRNERLISSGLRGSGRPSKRQRRQIIRFQDAPTDVSGDANGSGTEKRFSSDQDED